MKMKTNMLMSGPSNHYLDSVVLKHKLIKCFIS